MLGAYEFTDPFQVLMRCTGCCETRPDPIEGDVGGTSACVVTCHFALVQHQCLSITNPRMLTNLKWNAITFQSVADMTTTTKTAGRKGHRQPSGYKVMGHIILDFPLSIDFGTVLQCSISTWSGIWCFTYQAFCRLNLWLCMNTCKQPWNGAWSLPKKRKADGILEAATILIRWMADEAALSQVMDWCGLPWSWSEDTKIIQDQQTTSNNNHQWHHDHQTGSFGAKLQLQIPGASCQNLSWAKVTNAVVFPRYVRIKGMAHQHTSTSNKKKVMCRVCSTLMLAYLWHHCHRPTLQAQTPRSCEAVSSSTQLGRPGPAMAMSSGHMVIQHESDGMWQQNESTIR